MWEEGWQAADSRDGGAPHGGVGVRDVPVEDVDHQQANVWLVSRGLDQEVTDTGLGLEFNVE